MIQLEQEKLSKQQQNLLHALRLMNRIDGSQPKATVQSGALVQLENGLYFISVSLGKILYHDVEVFCLAPASPLAQAMLGQNPAGSFTFRGKKWKVEAVI